MVAKPSPPCPPPPPAAGAAAVVLPLPAAAAAAAAVVFLPSAAQLLQNCWCLLLLLHCRIKCCHVLLSGLHTALTAAASGHGQWQQLRPDHLSQAGCQQGPEGVHCTCTVRRGVVMW